MGSVGIGPVNLGQAVATLRVVKYSKREVIPKVFNLYGKSRRQLRTTEGREDSSMGWLIACEQARFFLRLFSRFPSFFFCRGCSHAFDVVHSLLHYSFLACFSSFCLYARFPSYPRNDVTILRPFRSSVGCAGTSITNIKVTNSTFININYISILKRMILSTNDRIWIFYAISSYCTFF